MASKKESPAEETLEVPAGPSMNDRLQAWFVAEGAWWAASFVFHMLLMGVMMVIGTKYAPKTEGETVSIEGADVEKNEPPVPPDKLEKFEVGNTPLDPTELSTETLQLTTAPTIEAGDGGAGGMPEGGGTPMAAAGPMLGGLGGFTINAKGPGPAVRGRGGVGSGVGTGTHAGSGGAGYGFGGRGSGKGGLTGGFGGTKNSERAVAAALNWIARHQNPNGSWSLDEFNKRCKASSDGVCSGVGSAKSDSAATAMALLPFLAAGQTHSKQGPYRQTIYSGLYWLISNQKKTGDLSAGTSHVMYSHGLAAICMCEAYGLSGDRVVGNAAQLAIDFIERVQNKQHGGWRYAATSTDGDTSVVGWQVMALKSAQMAYLRVNQESFDLVKKWLASVAYGNYKGLYGYQDKGGSPAMTGVGLLLQQYMGMKPGDPAMREGVEFIMKRLPDNRTRQLYFWYYATQVMHNIPGQDWDAWNRKMRRVLIESQIKDGCMAGSWDPVRPSREQMGESGGRLAVTSLSALTLEVYYRYLPLYKLDNAAAMAGVPRPSATELAKPPEPEAKPAEKPEAKPPEKPAAKAPDKAVPKAAEKPAAEQTEKPPVKPEAKKPAGKTAAKASAKTGKPSGKAGGKAAEKTPAKN